MVELAKPTRGEVEIAPALFTSVHGGKEKKERCTSFSYEKRGSNILPFCWRAKIRDNTKRGVKYSRMGSPKKERLTFSIERK